SVSRSSASTAVRWVLLDALPALDRSPDMASLRRAAVPARILEQQWGPVVAHSTGPEGLYGPPSDGMGRKPRAPVPDRGWPCHDHAAGVPLQRLQQPDPDRSGHGLVRPAAGRLPDHDLRPQSEADQPELRQGHRPLGPEAPPLCPPHLVLMTCRSG